MAPLLQRQPSTGRMKECWASLSSSPSLSLSLSLIDMWNLGLNLVKGDRENARERAREWEKRPRSPSGTLEGCWALSGQRLTQTVPSLSVSMTSSTVVCSLTHHIVLLFLCQSSCHFPICLHLSVNFIFVLFSVFWSCHFLLQFFSLFFFILFFLKKKIVSHFTLRTLPAYIYRFRFCTIQIYNYFFPKLHAFLSHYTACELSKECNNGVACCYGRIINEEVVWCSLTCLAVFYPPYTTAIYRL